MIQDKFKNDYQRNHCHNYTWVDIFYCNYEHQVGYVSLSITSLSLYHIMTHHLFHDNA